MDSATVDWFSVHEHVAPFLEGVGSWPMAGTVAWSGLDDDDPRKLAALLDGARHHALRIDAAQEARAEASRAIASAADWLSIGREMHQLSEFRKTHPWTRRGSR